MKRRSIRPPLRDDAGAALLFTLILITVVAMVTAAMLSFSDTSIRTTVALRDQGDTAYAADGAAKAAVNQLRQDNFNGAAGQCATTSSSLQLPNFYPSANGLAASSAYVSCTPDPGNTTGGTPSANQSPGSAILTLGTSAGEDGLYIKSNAGPIKIRGGVFSNSTIDAIAGGLDNTYNNPPSLPYNLARGACSGGAPITPTAYTTCNYATADPRGTDPGLLTPHGASYDTPPAASGNGVVGGCTGGATYQKVTPGRFTDAAALTAMTGCTTGIVQFTPGDYYFDFGGASHLWTIDHTYVVGGTPTIPLTATPTAAAMPTACVAPADAAATTSSGVRFIFGGDSQLVVAHTGSPGGQLTICASRSASGPPISVYGLKTALGGSFPVSAQSGCITAIAGCAVMYSDNSPNTTLTIQGTTYTPRSWINITLNNSSNQVFRWGLICRALTINTTGSANLANAIIDVPNVATTATPTPNIMYLKVYVCPTASTCTASGQLQLRAKVQVTGVAPRTVTVLSWSVQR